MVSPQENYPGAAVSTTGIDDRGIRQQSTTSTVVTHEPAGYLSGGSLGLHRHHFWGPVIAGTLVAMSISILSSALMFACRVGVYTPTGEVSLGVGAAIWICITACIAYFVGGMVASSVYNVGDDLGWMRGLSVWGLSVPLTMVITSIVALGAIGTYGTGTVQNTANVGISHNYFSPIFRIGPGEAWTVFISLLLGLIFAVIGGMSSNRLDSLDLDRNRTSSEFAHR